MSRDRATRTEDGAMAVVVAVLSLTLFLFAAFVVDLGWARDTKRQAQNAADAAALAAGNVLYGNSTTPDFTRAVNAARDYARRNFGVTAGQWTGCTDTQALRHRPDGATTCISFQNSTSQSLDLTRPDTVRVLLPVRSVPAVFAGLAGVSSFTVSAQARVSLLVDPEVPCALCVLGELRPHPLQNGNVVVRGGNIHFNGDTSVSSGGGLTVDAGRRITIQGTASGGGYSPAPLTGQPFMQDPLRFMQMPDPTSVPNRSGNSPCTAGPGRYGSWSFSGGTCTLQPGLYVIAGNPASPATWGVSGSTTVSGTGVTLLFTCGTPAVPAACATPDGAGTTGATLDASGSGAWRLTGPTSGPQRGHLLLYSRNNTAGFKLTGNANTLLRGTIYAARANFQVNGQACASTVESLIVVHSLAFSGNPACLTSDYQAPANAELPPASPHLSW